MANMDEQILSMLAPMLSTVDADLQEGIGKMFDLNPNIQDQYLEGTSIMKQSNDPITDSCVNDNSQLANQLHTERSWHEHINKYIYIYLLKEHEL